MTPELAELTEAVMIWCTWVKKDDGNTAEGNTVKELVDVAEKRLPTKIGEPTDLLNPDWHDFLIRLAGERGTINTKKVSNWLRKFEGPHRRRASYSTHQ